MSRNPKLTTAPSSGEMLLGWMYLLFSQLVLPTLLHLINKMLGNPMDSGWMNFLYFSVNFAAVAVLFRSFLGRSINAMGKYFLRMLRGAFLGFCVYYVTNLALGWGMHSIFPDFSNINDENVTALVGSNYLPMVIGTVVLVPITEEVLCRGMIFHSLYLKNKALAYSVSALVFCAIHVIGYIGSTDIGTLALCFIQYLPASLCLAWAYVEADNIVAPILIHSLANAMGIYAMR